MSDQPCLSSQRFLKRGLFTHRGKQTESRRLRMAWRHEMEQKFGSKEEKHDRLDQFELTEVVTKHFALGAERGQHINRCGPVD